MTYIVKISTKGQATIPHEIRLALHVQPGDSISWEMGEDGTARVRRIPPIDRDYLSAVQDTLSEWAGEADEAAYRDL